MEALEPHLLLKRRSLEGMRLSTGAGGLLGAYCRQPAFPTHLPGWARAGSWQQLPRLLQTHSPLSPPAGRTVCSHSARPIPTRVGRQKGPTWLGCRTGGAPACERQLGAGSPLHMASALSVPLVRLPWVHHDELFEHTKGCLTHYTAAADSYDAPGTPENLVQDPELQHHPGQVHTSPQCSLPLGGVPALTLCVPAPPHLRMTPLPASTCFSMCDRPLAA